jgi:hypothetical protein
MNSPRLEHNVILPKLPKDIVRLEAYPATIALEGARMLLNQSPNAGKRRRPEKNHICVFDTEELAQETSAVERTLDFPMIEWQFTDENTEFGTNVENGLKALLHNNNSWMETGFGEMRSKRRRCECNRLVRCRPFLSHLSHLSLQVSASTLSQQTVDKN